MNQIPEIERLQEAKRRALNVADVRAKENVKLRAALQEIATMRQPSGGIEHEWREAWDKIQDVARGASAGGRNEDAERR